MTLFLALIFIFVLSGDSYAALADNLTLALEMEEASGQRNDSTANALHFTDNNTVTQGVGKIGNAAQFTPTNSEYLSRANNALLQPSGGAMTIEAWINLDNVSGTKAIYNKDGVSSNRGFALMVEGQSARIYAWDSVSGFTSVIHPTNMNAGNWYQIIAWFDPADKKAWITLNLGTPASSTALTNGIISNGTAAVEIGGRGTNNDAYFAGRIDMVRFWQRMLTSDERTALYNSGVGLTAEAIIATGSGGGGSAEFFRRRNP